MRAKDFVPASKPRNFVAKNQKTAGAGAHKDKKRAAKQGDVKHKKQEVEEGWDDIKKFGKKAAVAGAIGLGALGSAQAQDAPSGEDFLPDIVAHVTFKVDGKTITKDINLGTTYKSPGQAGDALAKFLKSKGIKYYDYSLERVKPKDKDYLDKAPYTDSGKANGQIDTGPAVDTKSKGDYMSKEGVAEGLPQTLRKVVPGYAKREIDKKMDAEKFGRTDVDRDANYYRYKKIQDKIKKKG